jgi:hypothetical protein
VNRCIDSAWTGSSRGRVHGSIGTAVLAYIVGKILASWHRALIRGEAPLNGQWFNFDAHHLLTVNSERCVGDLFRLPHLYLILPYHCRASRLLAAMKVALGLMGGSISGDGLKPYLRPPAPPPNPFVKYPSPPVEDSTRVPPARPIPARKLIRPLFSARLEAERTLVDYMSAADLPHEPPWVEIRRRTELLASRRFA